MPNSMRSKVIRDLVTEKLKMIQEADESYILYNMNEEKIEDIKLINEENFARIIITTDQGKVYHLTPSEFLRKTVIIKKGGKEITVSGK